MAEHAELAAPSGPTNDMRELYALQHAIADAGGAMAPGVHKAIDALREVWDRDLRRAQAEAHQYRTALQGAARAAVPAGQTPATDQAGVAAVRVLHQSMSRAGFLICAHCSGWNGVRCLGVVADYPCPTIAALDESPSAVVVRRATDETPDVQHAPGTAILCPDCRAKGYSVCMDNAAQQPKENRP